MNNYTNFSKLAVGGVPVVPGFGSEIITGSVFYVDSVTGSNSYEGKTPQRPFATLDYAIGKCTAGEGDVIYVLPLHAETVTSSSILADVSDVSIIGLGRGLRRPTFTFSTDVTIAVSGASNRWQNCVFNANFADVAIGLTVSGKDFNLLGCSFVEAGANLNWFTCVGTSATANAADGLTIVGCEEFSIDANTKAFLSILEATDRAKIQGNYVTQASAADIGHFMIMGAFVMKHTLVTDNMLNLTGDNNAQAVGIFMTGSSTTSTGIVARNYVGSLDTTTELLDTATLDFHHFENYATGTIAKSGTILPAIEA